MDLEIDQLQKIRRIFLTHSHLDHVLGLPLMLDTIQEEVEANPLQLYLTQQTDDVLREHLFNWRLWPDFFNLGENEPQMLFSNIIDVGQTITQADMVLQVLPAQHSVPAVGYLVTGESGKKLAFSGDCTSNDELWLALNKHDHLDTLIIECSYPEEELELSLKAKHYCTSTLAEDLSKLEHQPDIYLTHLKPGKEDYIVEQLQKIVPNRKISALRNGMQFEL